MVHKTSKKLFGTDGIRGMANQFPMTVDVVSRVGQALGFLLKQMETRPGRDRRHVLIGKDTRLSGYMIEMALASGLNSMGVDVQLVGPLPTPGIGFLARNMRADAGIVISASHNPYFDNGIKIFGSDGFKISRELETQIESIVFDDEFEMKLPECEGIGRSKRIEDATGRYVVHVKNTFPLHMTLEGLRIVLDCANGASYKVGPAILEELGAETIVLADTPNGMNINDKCGALHPEGVASAVVTYRADVGISLDGDADRVILVDENGDIVNGDHILAICGLHMKKKGRLDNNTLVTTQMCNFGLDQVLGKNQIQIVKTDVGDKYVVDEMRKNHFVLGGESSGHIIFLDHSTTGDGMVAALRVLSIMIEERKKLSELNQVMVDVPQVVRNVRVRRRTPLKEISGFSELVKSIEEDLEGNGRVFVRYSGTEPLVRVMVEGVDLVTINRCADDLAAFLQSQLES